MKVKKFFRTKESAPHRHEHIQKKTKLRSSCHWDSGFSTISPALFLLDPLHLKATKETGSKSIEWICMYEKEVVRKARARGTQFIQARWLLLGQAPFSCKKKEILHSKVSAQVQNCKQERQAATSGWGCGLGLWSDAMAALSRTALARCKPAKTALTSARTIHGPAIPTNEELYDEVSLLASWCMYSNISVDTNPTEPFRLLNTQRSPGSGQRTKSPKRKSRPKSRPWRPWRRKSTTSTCPNTSDGGHGCWIRRTWHPPPFLPLSSSPTPQWLRGCPNPTIRWR